ncbi:MAG TPA: hypothetical protein ENK91_00755 [Bacteroidetes bacterium]|nr:hypothetical protein [Bacteroidota bacterium]
MENEILYREEVSVSKTAKQWIIAIVLLIDTIGFFLLYHYYIIGKIPNNNFDKDAMIAVSAIALIFTMIIFLVIFLLGYVITIDKTGVHLKGKAGEKKNITPNQIDYFKQITKKESQKFMYTGKNTKRKKGKAKQFLIGTPNYLLVLKNGEKVLLQIKKKPSFEYSLNKILEHNG